MMHIFINAIAASAGGGLTYIRNVLPSFTEQPDVKITIAANSDLAKELRGRYEVDVVKINLSTLRRFWYEQFELPGVIGSCQADVLLSTGNFAIRRSPVPQILLSRNSLYLCRECYRDLLSRHD